MAAVGFEDDGRFDGINDRNQLAAAEWSLRVRLNEAHMQAGVTMRDPSTVYLDWSVDLAPDVTLEPNVILRGRTTIGTGSVIGPGSELIDATVGERATVWASVVEASVIEDDATVGPFSHLRAGTVVGRGAQVGNYAELKNTHLGAGSKQHHASYLGDAEIGEGVNVGAGTITANFDGTSKQHTTVGDGAFLGVDTMLIAPVEVGEGAQHRRRRRRHARRPGGQARRRHPGPHPRAPGEAESRRSRRRTTRSHRRSNARCRGRRSSVSFPFVELVVIVFLTILEGFFVAAEIALVSIRRSRVEQLVEEGRPGARRVSRLIHDPGRFLAVCQLGLTVIGFFASAYAAVSLTDQLSSLLAGAGMDRGTAQGLSLILVTILLALFTIVFAELVPKTLALANAERFAITLSLPIEFLARALGPVIAVLTWITSKITGLFGANVTSEQQITRRGASADRRARRRAGHPRGRGGADDQRGHRARQPARP